MRLILILLAFLGFANAFVIVLSNADGWADMNIRTFYGRLKDAGQNVIISAPAVPHKFAASKTRVAKWVTKGCQYMTCKKKSPPVGHDEHDNHINYVNSLPASAMEYGIEVLSPRLFNGSTPDLAISGINVGHNSRYGNHVSGNVGAALAASLMGIPSIAFNGFTGKRLPFFAPEGTSLAAKVYSDLAMKITRQVLEESNATAYLPSGYWLNVNFGKLWRNCTKAEDFKLVMARSTHYSHVKSGRDPKICGQVVWPTEHYVMHHRPHNRQHNCYVSMSIGYARTRKHAQNVEDSIVALFKNWIYCIPWAHPLRIGRIHYHNHPAHHDVHSHTFANSLPFGNATRGWRTSKYQWWGDTPDEGF